MKQKNLIGVILRLSVWDINDFITKMYHMILTSILSTGFGIQTWISFVLDGLQNFTELNIIYLNFVRLI